MPQQKNKDLKKEPHEALEANNAQSAEMVEVDAFFNRMTLAQANAIQKHLAKVRKAQIMKEMRERQLRREIEQRNQLQKQEKKKLKKKTEILVKRRKERLELKKENADLTTSKPAFTTYRNSSSNSQAFVDSEKSPSSQRSKNGDHHVNDRILWAKFEKEWTVVSSDALKVKKHNFLQVNSSDQTIALDQFTALLSGFRFLKPADKLA